jgi:hypothetical protein
MISVSGVSAWASLIEIPVSKGVAAARRVRRFSMGNLVLRKERSSFLKKRTKKLLLMGTVGETAAGPGAEVFLLLFSKKEVLIYFLVNLASVRS